MGQALQQLGLNKSFWLVNGVFGKMPFLFFLFWVPGALHLGSAARHHYYHCWYVA